MFLETGGADAEWACMIKTGKDSGGPSLSTSSFMLVATLVSKVLELESLKRVIEKLKEEA